MRSAALLLILATLPACVAGEAVMQETTRGLARSAVNTAAARYVPGVDVTPFTNCVIDNAQTGELIELARAAGASAAGAGADAAVQAWPVVQTVIRRPETMQCLVSNISALQLAGAGGALL